ncbi:MAG: hypothetical protein OJF50_002515 [Nitrospira sp.]|jgi:hypothetical protein|nr:hypothetical protein [Nitrospira sp.]
MIRPAPSACVTGIDGLNVRDRSTIYTAGTQTLPRKVICGAVEIIMDCKSTASFANHGSTPFVDCEMTCLPFEWNMYLLPKHEHCQTDASSEVIDKSACQACRLTTGPLRRMRQLVPAHRRHVVSRPGRHNDDAACSLRRVCPRNAVDRPYTKSATTARHCRME